MAIVGTFQKNVNGTPVTVAATDGGAFCITLDDILYSAPTLESVMERAKRHLRVRKVEHAIPLVIKGENGYLCRAILRGRHARTDEFLFTITLPSGETKKEGLKYPTIVADGADVTDEQITEANRLISIAREHTRAADQYVYALQKDDKGRRRQVLYPGGLLTAAENAAVIALDGGGQEATS
jgi:hypothetical protein